MQLVYLKTKFILIEKEHFNIINCYIKGKVTYEEVDRFGKLLLEFRKELYEYVPKPDEILKIANMKSKIQHYNTEILEDEELLQVAYSNVKGYIEKL